MLFSKAQLERQGLACSEFSFRTDTRKGGWDSEMGKEGSHHKDAVS
jgi:hypothetical protein